jgi:hypothetical protein
MKATKLTSRIAVLFLVLFISQTIHAQSQTRSVTPDQRERIQSRKIAFLTDKLDLSPAEAEKFWPIYNAYQERLGNEMKTFRKEHQYNPKDIDNLSDEEANAFLNAQLQQAQKMLDYKKEYQLELKKALSPQKIVKLFEAEKEFREELIRHVAGRRIQQQRKTN